VLWEGLSSTQQYIDHSKLAPIVITNEHILETIGLALKIPFVRDFWASLVHIVRNLTLLMESVWLNLGIKRKFSKTQKLKLIDSEFLGSTSLFSN